MRGAGAYALVSCLSLACDRGPSAPVRAGVRLDGGGAPGRVEVFVAVRCAECHGRIYDQWKASPHALAQVSTVYSAMRTRAGGTGCDACHAPLAERVDPGELSAHEGVSCEICHRVRAVEARRSGAGFTLELVDTIKLGPLCDAKNNYFHKMGCSPLHEEGRFCAACHLWYAPRPGGIELPIFTEYDEWRSGPYAKNGVDCQQCHMPGELAEVAAGSKPRLGVPQHGLWGRD